MSDSFLPTQLWAVEYWSLGLKCWCLWMMFPTLAEAEDLMGAAKDFGCAAKDFGCKARIREGRVEWR